MVHQYRKLTVSHHIQRCPYLSLLMKINTSDCSTLSLVCDFLLTSDTFEVTCITGQCTHSMLAHLDSVTSLSIDAAGFSLVSGGHDCSVRFWDLLGTRACVQEISSHREKALEGVLDVEFHSSLPFMASAGADGVVKLYASSS